MSDNDNGPRPMAGAQDIESLATPDRAIDEVQRQADLERLTLLRAFEKGANDLEAKGDTVRAAQLRDAADALMSDAEAKRDHEIDDLAERIEGAEIARETENEDRIQEQDREKREQVAQAEHREEQRQEEHRNSDDLAELFLNGSTIAIANEPKLANACAVQEEMENHLAEVFSGDVRGFVSASHESRAMISDMLRRDFDVSIREPTPTHQIESTIVRQREEPQLER